MATSTVSVDTMAVKTENFDYVVYGRTVNDAGVDLPAGAPEIKLVKGGEDSTKYTEDKGWQKILTTSVKSYRAGTVDAFAELIPDEAERVAIFNRGLAQKFNQKITAQFTEIDPNTGTLAVELDGDVFDSIELLREPTQRRNLSPLDRALKAVKNSGLTPEQLAELFAQLQSVR